MRQAESSSERSGRRVFVGRERELAQLVDGFADAATGSGRLFLIAGDPGIGKTRLAIELIAHAAPRGARILWGRGWEGGGAPAYWPWVQIVRGYARSCDPDTLLAQLGGGGAHLANLVPELRDRCPQLPAAVGPLSAESEHARFQLFDAFTTFLRNASAHQPLVIVVDDVHVADQPSLLLLRFVARELREMGVMVIATFREVEARRDTWLAATLGQLAREGQLLPLRGLNAADASLLIAQVAEQSPPEKVVAAIHAATEGNPFFIDEVVRLLVAEGRLLRAAQPGSSGLGIPDAVRAAIRRRLEPLSEAATRMLRIAAVFGREFDHRQLQQVCDLPADTFQALLADATAVGALMEAPAAVGRYAFSHPLIREALYEDQAAALRVDLHRRIGESLEHAHAANLEPYLPELAHHFLCAATASDSGKAISYAVGAARRALSQLAYEDAAIWYERALKVEGRDAPAAARRCEVLLALGDAQRRAGESAAARQAFVEAARLARARAAPEDLARAALGVGWAGAETGAVDETLVELLEEALAVLPPGDGVLRTAVLGRLAVALYFSPFAERRAALSQQAVEMARRLGDAQALATALMTRHFAIWGPGSAEERLALATELTRLGERMGNPDTTLEGRDWRIIDLLELGDVQAARVETEAFARFADELRVPRYGRHALLLRSAYAHLEGNYADSERLAQLALEEGERMQVPNSQQFFAVQLFGLRREQGRLGELEAAVRQHAERYPALPIWRCGLAFLYAELDRLSEAGRELRALAARRFADLPRDVNWLAGVALLAEVCAALNDPEAASSLYELLLPFASLNVVVATGVACYGAVAYYLGLLATSTMQWDAAAAHFEYAVERNTRLGSPPWTAYAQFAHARMLAQAGRRGPSDANAGPLLVQCLATARRLDMRGLVRKAESLARSIGVSPQPTEAGATVRPETVPNVFRREGDYWTILFRGATVRLKDSKGLQYIHYLIRHPGKELHTLELVAAMSPVEDARMLASGDAGAILDGKARAGYRRRVRELEEDLAEARVFNDAGRVERAQCEIDQLAQELAAAVGLGGRERRAGSFNERSRVSVTKAIGIAIKRVGEHHAALADHLSSTIKTGSFCSYAIDGRDSLDWVV